MEKGRKRKERQIAAASDGCGKQRYGEGVRKENRRRKRERVRREEAGRGVEGDNNMRESLRSRGDWGNRGRERHSNAGEEREQSALFVCAGLRVQV